MQNGIKSFQSLAAAFPVAASTALVTLTGFIFPVVAGKKYHFRIAGGFTLGATGGFKFLVNALDAAGVTAAPTAFLQSSVVTDGVTAAPGSVICDVVTAPANFADALAVAGNHSLQIEGEVVPSATGTIVLQVACNSAANAITVLKGAFLEVTAL